MQEFDYDRDYSRLDLRRRPDLYRIGRGEQGVLLVEPYKSEILPHWRFRTATEARKSAAAIYRLYRHYLRAQDFVGMDMTRKFLQMGFTRARRYANHRSGRKWSADKTEVLPRDPDPVKAESASLFYDAYAEAREDPVYQELKRSHLARYPVSDD